MEFRDHHFTLQEAQALVAWLQETFDAIEPLKQPLASASGRVQQLMGTMQSNGGAQSEEQLIQAQQDLQYAEDAIDEHTYAIEERGIILRSVERGLVDFPSIERRSNRLSMLVGGRE